MRPSLSTIAAVDILTTLDDLVLDGEKKRGMIKGVFLLKRKPAFLRADFKRYWKDVHAPLVKKLPGLRRYVLSHTVDEAYEWAEPRWDGVAHLYFDDAQAAERALVSDTFNKESYPDLDKFVSVMTGCGCRSITSCRSMSAPNSGPNLKRDLKPAVSSGPAVRPPPQ